MSSMNEPFAKEIAARLRQAGFQALYAGGWVRDRLLGMKSQDIDIATDATPGEVAALFSKTILVGAQFGVVRVIENGYEFEIATFRVDEQYQNGRNPETVRLVRCPKEDALRRDFTINGIFYDPFSEQIIDYVNGQKDLEAKIIRTIGEPSERFSEDRLRMMRAIRFATTLEAQIEENTWHTIKQFSSSLRPAVSPERLWQELNKIYATQEPAKLAKGLTLFYASNLLFQLFPHLKELSDQEIIKRIVTIEKAPPHTPLPFLLSLLITSADPIPKESCIGSFRTSKEEIQMAIFHQRLEKAFETGGDDFFWAQLYAHPHFDAAFLTLPQSRDVKLLKEHQERREPLKQWTAKIQNKTSIVTAQDLLDLGYQPGKELGELLKRAEQLAVNERISSKDALLKRLLQQGKK